MKKRALQMFVMGVFIAMLFVSFRVPLQYAQGGEDNGSKLNAPTDKAAYFSHGDMETIWKDLEAKQARNKRVLAGKKYDINVRIYTPGSPALVHDLNADIWVCEAGSAVAVTGGKLINPKKQKNGTGDSIFGGDTSGDSIEGGTEQAFTPGDVLFVPPGVPHTFKDMKGFRAYLIRFDPN